MGCSMIEAITWSQLELKSLIEDEESRVHYERAKRHLALHPSHLTDLNAALREILTATLNKYDAKSEGIILSYKNPKLLTRMGTVLHDACFIHVDIEADFYVFRPRVDDTLKGIVNKTSEDHVGLLVHKTFNVAIPRPNEDQNWPGRLIQVGQEVRFTVTYLDFKGRLPYIRGSMDAQDYLRGCRLVTEVKSNKTTFASDEEEAVEDDSVEDSGIEEKVTLKKSTIVKREKEDDGGRKSKKKYKLESEEAEEYSERKRTNGKKKKKSRVKAEDIVAETESEASQRDLEEEAVPRTSKKSRRDSSVDPDSDFHESAKSERKTKDERNKKKHKIKTEIFSSETEESDVNKSKRSKRVEVESDVDHRRKKHKIKTEVLSSEAESVANETNHESNVSEFVVEKSKKRRRIKAEVLTQETYD